jgi:hypothetical protein
VDEEEYDHFDEIPSFSIDIEAMSVTNNEEKLFMFRS